MFHVLHPCARCCISACYACRSTRCHSGSSTWGSCDCCNHSRQYEARRSWEQGTAHEQCVTRTNDRKYTRHLLSLSRRAAALAASCTAPKLSAVACCEILRTSTGCQEWQQRRSRSCPNAARDANTGAGCCSRPSPCNSKCSPEALRHFRLIAAAACNTNTSAAHGMCCSWHWHPGCDEMARSERICWHGLCRVQRLCCCCRAQRQSCGWLAGWLSAAEWPAAAVRTCCLSLASMRSYCSRCRRLTSSSCPDTSLISSRKARG